MLILSNSLSIDWCSFFETDNIVLVLKYFQDFALKGPHRNKAYNFLFLCNPYHQLSAIKEIASYSFVFYSWVYICETVCKIIEGKIYFLPFLFIYLFTYLFTSLLPYFLPYLPTYLFPSLFLSFLPYLLT